MADIIETARDGTMERQREFNVGLRPSSSARVESLVILDSRFSILILQGLGFAECDTREEQRVVGLATPEDGEKSPYRVILSVVACIAKDSPGIALTAHGPGAEVSHYIETSLRTAIQGNQKKGHESMKCKVGGGLGFCNIIRKKVALAFARYL